MKYNLVKNKIEEATELKEKYEKRLQALNEALIKIKEWKNKTLDSRFFESHFAILEEDGKTVKTDYKGNVYTRAYIRKNTYSFGKPYGLYVAGYKVDIDTRDTAHVIEAVQMEIDSHIVWVKRQEGLIERLSKFNEQALVDDLLAVYEKHGKPDMWKEILDVYEVKYPENN